MRPETFSLRLVFVSLILGNIYIYIYIQAEDKGGAFKNRVSVEFVLTSQPMEIGNSWPWLIVIHIHKYRYRQSNFRVMQNISLCFVLGNYVGVVQKGRTSGIRPCHCKLPLLQRRQVDYGTASRRLLFLSMEEENTKDSTAAQDVSKYTSKSKQKVESGSVPSQDSTEDSKSSSGSTRKKPTTKRKRKSKKQEPLPSNEEVTVPISRKPNPASGASDYWIDPKDVVVEQEKKTHAASSKTDLSNDMKTKLKTEIVSPYRQNWILLLIAAVVLLTLAYRFLPANQIFDRIPDL